MFACSSRVTNGRGRARAAQLFFVPRRDDRPSEARNLRQAGAAIEQVVNLITMRNASQRRREGGREQHDVCGPRRRRQLHCGERSRQKQRGRRSQSRLGRGVEEVGGSASVNIQSVNQLVRTSGARTGLSEEVNLRWNPFICQKCISDRGMCMARYQ